MCDPGDDRRDVNAWENGTGSIVKLTRLSIWHRRGIADGISRNIIIARRRLGLYSMALQAGSNGVYRV